MHIFVINLPEDVARRNAIEKQLRELELPHEFFPAIRGKLLSPAEKNQHYDATWFNRNEGRPALPGELGCALSHIAVYRLVKARNLSHALVLEDDAWLNPNLPQLLRAIEEQYQSDKPDLFLLTWTIAVTADTSKALWSSYRLAKMKAAYCTHGYVVTNAAAGALISALYPISHLADCWGWLRRHGIVRIRSVYPTCITANLAYETSTTPNLAKSVMVRTQLQRLAHKIYRGYWWTFDQMLAVIHRVGINK